MEIDQMKWVAGGLMALVTMGVASSVMAADGKTVYEASCVACHATGVANAPKLGDKAAWAPRVATGKAALLGSVKTGKGAMPPKAGNAALTDADIGAAIDFMLAAAK
jgi:cytochrome c5